MRCRACRIPLNVTLICFPYEKTTGLVEPVVWNFFDSGSPAARSSSRGNDHDGRNNSDLSGRDCHGLHGNVLMKTEREPEVNYAAAGAPDGKAPGCAARR